MTHIFVCVFKISIHDKLNRFLKRSRATHGAVDPAYCLSLWKPICSPFRTVLLTYSVTLKTIRIQSTTIWQFSFKVFFFLKIVFSSTLPPRVIPASKHFLSRQDGQFFLLSLSMVQSFLLAHKYFCLPSDKKERQMSRLGQQWKQGAISNVSFEFQVKGACECVFDPPGLLSNSCLPSAALLKKTLQLPQVSAP